MNDVDADPDDSYHERFEMPDGHSIVVRPTTVDDAPGLLDFYAALSNRDRRLRFFSSFTPDLDWCEQWSSIGDRGGFGVVAVKRDSRATGDPEGSVVAEAGYAIRGDGDGDFAVTVAPESRGWLGPYLVDVLARYGAAHGIRNLQADILLENRPMLRIMQHRGSVTLEHAGGTVRCSVPTSGPVSSWPPLDHRPRVLAEVAGGRWAGVSAADRAGVNVVMCSGPSRRRGDCPALTGDRCPLVEGADVIVVGLDPEAADTTDLIASHLERSPGTPVVVRHGPETADPGGCVSVERFDDAAIHQVIELALNRSASREEATGDQASE